MYSNIYTDTRQFAFDTLSIKNLGLISTVLLFALLLIDGVCCVSILSLNSSRTKLEHDRSPYGLNLNLPIIFQLRSKTRRTFLKIRLVHFVKLCLQISYLCCVTTVAVMCFSKLWANVGKRSFWSGRKGLRRSSRLKVTWCVI